MVVLFCLFVFVVVLFVCCFFVCPCLFYFVLVFALFCLLSSLFWGAEGNTSFNDVLNTFYLRLYDVGHMVKDHSDSERGNPLPPHGLLFPISNNGSFICTIPQTGEHIPRPLLHQSWSTGWIGELVEFLSLCVFCYFVFIKRCIQLIT